MLLPAFHRALSSRHGLVTELLAKFTIPTKSNALGFCSSDIPELMQQQTSAGGDAHQQLFDADVPKRRFINRGINRVELLGGVGGPPVIKQTAQGSAFASFNLYTNVDRRLSTGGTMTTTEVHNVIAFGGMAKYVEKHVEKGSRVYLTGRLHYTGGMLNVDGTRTPRICSVNLESIYPLSKMGATYSVTGSH